MAKVSAEPVFALSDECFVAALTWAQHLPHTDPGFTFCVKPSDYADVERVSRWAVNAESRQLSAAARGRFQDLLVAAFGTTDAYTDAHNKWKEQQ